MGFKNGPEFRKFLNERLGLILPQNVQLAKTKKHGIRVYVKGIKTDRVFGLPGFMTYSKKSGLNPYFFQLFGHLSKKNIIALTEHEAKAYAAGEAVQKKIKIDKGVVVLVHKGHVLGHGIYDGRGSISCPLRKKRKRALNNSIKPWPGRQL
ncbi:MAG: hypothetical protein QXF35_01930 [Candidatus Bilamarchaeaceae archaeon]